jgi:hypothetical protein
LLCSNTILLTIELIDHIVAKKSLLFMANKNCLTTLDSLVFPSIGALTLARNVAPNGVTQHRAQHRANPSAAFIIAYCIA